MVTNFREGLALGRRIRGLHGSVFKSLRNLSVRASKDDSVYNATPPTVSSWSLFFTVAFSAVPLTLYIPPVRSLNLFVETMEDLLRESRGYTARFYPRARHVWSRLLDVLLCNFRSE
ncbi:unnamed protein product [Dovyalis caffra]|uniref:Uncharacterized protein n=1 Tax=Dovyalis caffra TaxID=77055 RepID=A0AAV1RCU2_9ROSI|nr:unnamed protein product [Dovyalis caffra]